MATPTAQFGDIGMGDMSADMAAPDMASEAATPEDAAQDDVTTQLDAMDPLAIVDYLKTKGILDKDFEAKLPEAESPDAMPAEPGADAGGFGGIDLSALSAAPAA